MHVLHDLHKYVFLFCQESYHKAETEKDLFFTELF